MSDMYPQWLTQLVEAVGSGGCVRITDPVPWGRGIALALAPHPDDPDAIALTLKRLADAGWDLHWAIVTSGWSGVRDDFAGPGRDAKARTRRSEQWESARLFGLSEDRLMFMELAETDDGELARTDDNHRALISLLDELAPDLVLLPHGRDSNATHRLVSEWFAEWAQGCERPILALGNEDPKTKGFHPHVATFFGEAEAEWKASLLECHRTQSQRNQMTRGITFAERILGVNRRAAGDASGVYAERFEAACWGISPAI